MVCEITYTTVVVRNATQVVHRHLCEMESFMALGLRNEACDRLQIVNGQVDRVSRFVKSSRVGRSVAVQASLAPMAGIVERLRTVTRILLRKRRRRYSSSFSNVLHCDKSLEKTILKSVPSVYDLNIGAWNDGEREVSYKSRTMGKDIVHEKLQVSNESVGGKETLIFLEVDRMKGPVDVDMVTTWRIDERKGINVDVSIISESCFVSRIVTNMMKKKIKNSMREILDDLP